MIFGSSIVTGRIKSKLLFHYDSPNDFVEQLLNDLPLLLVFEDGLRHECRGARGSCQEQTD